MNGAKSFQQAIEAHAAGHLSEAYKLYSAARVHGCSEAGLYQNFGALCRKRGDTDKAAAVFKEGLERHEGNVGILANRINLWKDIRPHAAIEDLLYCLRRDPGLVESWVNLLYVLHEQGCFSWALSLVEEAMVHHPDDARFPLRALTTILALSGSSPELLEQYEAILLSRVENMLPTQPATRQDELMIALACYGQTRNNNLLAKKYYSLLEGHFGKAVPTNEFDAREKAKNYHVASWNYSSFLLKSGDFANGWRLYDHGLQTPCEGNPVQKWQRELIKPFRVSQIPLWRGEPLHRKQLLVLSEQGIGDTVMFATLLPTLTNEGAELTLLTSDRMKKTYSSRCTFDLRVIELEDIKDGTIAPEQFDYQIPIGSICQHRFKHPSRFAPLSPVLKTKPGARDYFRTKYGVAANERLIGVSWKGGGSESRKREKSITSNELVSILGGHQGIRFVSLQYGATEGMQRELAKEGIDLIVDPDIDAIKGFAAWVDQVGACDAVVSVANTTIHGSGSLNIPTYCLLASKSDWRWLTDPALEVSYWYKSVGIARQHDDGSWDAAVTKVRNWLQEGSGMPLGQSFNVESEDWATEHHG